MLLFDLNISFYNAYMIFGNTPSDMFTVERFKALNNMLKEEEK